MTIRNSWRLILLITMAVMTLSACSGADQPAATATDAPPTATPFPTFAYVEPTKATIFEQTDEDAAAPTADESDAVELDPKLVERGRGRYEALECGNCHGDGR